jgi:hypothetical protein
MLSAMYTTRVLESIPKAVAAKIPTLAMKATGWRTKKVL